MSAGSSQLRQNQPEWLPPMLATLTEPRALPEGWVYEPKLDGWRCLAFVRDGEVKLFSRNRKPLNESYPGIAEALASRARGDMVLDGEIIAMDGQRGVSSFSLLQRRMQSSSVQLWLFDCLFYEGRDLTRLPLGDRKALLKDVVQFGGPIKFTPALNGSFAALYRDACRRGGEGLIAKRAGSRYTAGRSGDWVKLKCVNTQELVIGGWTEPQGSRTGLGALLVGHYDGDGTLHYAGKVGTGFDQRTLEDLARRLGRIERQRSPFGGGVVPTRGGLHWVAPTMIAQIGFAEWTPDGMLRHPRFLGLRDDKAPREVVRERRATAVVTSRRTRSVR